MKELLLVADLPWVADAVRAGLAGAGWELATVGDPAEAAAWWQAHHPEVVMVDLQIGARGGMAVVRDLRAAAYAAGVAPPATVVLLDRAVDSFLARRAGAAAWIRKPFNGFALRLLLDRLLAEQRAAAG